MTARLLPRSIHNLPPINHKSRHSHAACSSAVWILPPISLATNSSTQSTTYSVPDWCQPSNPPLMLFCHSRHRHCLTPAPWLILLVLVWWKTMNGDNTKGCEINSDRVVRAWIGGHSTVRPIVRDRRVKILRKGQCWLIFRLINCADRIVISWKQNSIFILEKGKN